MFPILAMELVLNMTMEDLEDLEDLE